MDLPSQPRLSHNHSVTPRELANSICDTLRRNGYQALLVGGCVRDLLLGREPADYDVTTDATPDKVVSLFPESVAVGAQFGVILIPRDGLKVEVATFRSDAGYSDGRHPDRVVYSKTPQEDVQRRDFTREKCSILWVGRRTSKRKSFGPSASPTAVSRKTNSA